MSTAKRGLGRGLNALIRNPEPVSPASAAAAREPVKAAEAAGRDRGVLRVPVVQITPSPWQPRRTFTPDALEELSASVKERGVLQPLLVRRVGAKFELIAGERRWRASKAAGLAEVPVIVMEAADEDALELAVIENVQREDLNVVEEAEAYRALADKFSLTQDQIAERTGKARASVANTMRLLNLPAPVRQLLAEKRLSAGHAKVLLGAADEELQRVLALRTVKDGLSVRDLERLMACGRKPARPGTPGETDLPATHLAHLSDLLHRHFGTSVRLVPSRKRSDGKPAKGRIEVDFYSHDDLDRILGLIGLQDRGEVDLSQI
ncbi:MAG: ParB/RepB/Spo0J family partition protein [Kiritimatiellia bacterium]